MANLSDTTLDFPLALTGIFQNNYQKALHSLETFEKEIFGDKGVAHNIILSYK